MELNDNDFFNEKKGTVHINAKKGDIAKVVLMCGDPLRAKTTANNHLENVKRVTTVRGMYGYTGTYKGKEVTIMGHGMGLPSIGIYSYELFKYYDVNVIMRFGTCGALIPSLEVGDVVVAQGACTNSSYAEQYKLPGVYSAIADFDLLLKTKMISDKLKIKTAFGNILSSDRFYDAADSALDWGRMNVLATEMEAYALYCNASYLNKKALTVLTVSDHLAKKGATFLTPKERQEKTQTMAKLVLEVAIKA